MCRHSTGRHQVKYVVSNPREALAKKSHNAFHPLQPTLQRNLYYGNKHRNEYQQKQNSIVDTLVQTGCQYVHNIPNLILAKPSTMIRTFASHRDISFCLMLLCLSFNSWYSNHAQLHSALSVSVCSNISTYRGNLHQLTYNTYRTRPAR